VGQQPWELRRQGRHASRELDAKAMKNTQCSQGVISTRSVQQLHATRRFTTTATRAIYGFAKPGAQVEDVI